MSEDVLQEQIGHVLKVTFNRPERLNSIGGKTLTLPASVTTTVSGTLTLDGGCSSHVSVQSSGSGAGNEFDLSVAAAADSISNAQFASNWELSAVRAAGVARSLVRGGHDPARLKPGLIGGLE